MARIPQHQPGWCSNFKTGGKQRTVNTWRDISEKCTSRCARLMKTCQHRGQRLVGDLKDIPERRVTSDELS